MAGQLFVRVNGGYKECVYDAVSDSAHGMFVRVNGSWKRVEEGYVRVDGVWEPFFGPGDVEPPPDPPTPGTHILPATALYLGGIDFGYAEFNTEEYRGYITEIRARISWKNTAGRTGTVGISGRPSSNYYRGITDIGDWANNTVDHRIDTFDAASLTEFNNGSAIGFNLSYDKNQRMDSLMSNVQLNLTIS